MKILDKYIISEMLSPFLFGLTTFTILFFAGSQLVVVSKLIAQAGASFKTAAIYMINCLPAILVFTLPMATLMASLISFGRLSGESELTAMKAGGISFLRISFPAILLSLAIALVSLYIWNYVAPNSTYKADNIFIEQFAKKNSQIAENLVIKNKGADGTERVIYSKKLIPSQNKMEDVTVQYFKGGKRIRELFAYEAYFNPKKGKWFMKKAYIHDFDENQDPRYTSASEEVTMPLFQSPTVLAKRRGRRPEEMTRAMLKEAMQEMERNGISSDKEWWRYRDYQIHYHQKIALPITCFIFGLFGIPLGVRPHRTSKAFGLGLSIVFIFVYYALMSIGMALGQNGKIDPFWAAWVPNIVFAVAGILLLLKKARE